MKKKEIHEHVSVICKEAVCKEEEQEQEQEEKTQLKKLTIGFVDGA
jgi:hypothetical protein